VGRIIGNDNESHSLKRAAFQVLRLSQVCINYLSITLKNCLTKEFIISIMSNENLEKEDSDAMF
jgi:hypothetical protein